MTLQEASVLTIFNVSTIGVGLVLLQISYFFAYKKNYKLHFPFMVAAIVTNAIFLITYIIKAVIEGPKSFTGPNLVAYFFYYPILVIHIIFAIAVIIMLIPFIKPSLRNKTPTPDGKNLYMKDKVFRAYHRARGKLIYILWSITFALGIIIFFMLYIIPWEAQA